MHFRLIIQLHTLSIIQPALKSLKRPAMKEKHTVQKLQNFKNILQLKLI
jgi:hypothetical protein